MFLCVYSMVMDHYRDKWTNPPYTAPITPTFPYQPDVLPSVPDPVVLPNLIPYPAPATKPITEEEIKELRELLERAREYDRRNNEPDCELEEKKREIKELAEKHGVKIDFL